MRPSGSSPWRPPIVRSGTPRANCWRSPPGAPAMRPRRKRWYDIDPDRCRKRRPATRTPCRDAHRAAARPTARVEGEPMNRARAYIYSSLRRSRCRSVAAAACPMPRISIRLIGLPATWFDTKKPLPGERKELFPAGVPGVSRGVPPDLVKGNQPPPERRHDRAGWSRSRRPKPKPKAKPKPKVAAKPAPVASTPSRRR